MTADTITAGALSSTNVEPDALDVSVVGEVTVTFTLANPLPADGKVVIIFPSGLALSSGATTDIGAVGTSFDGSESVTVSSQTVTVTRSGGTEVTAGSAVSLELTNVKNPTTAGSTGTYTIRTTNSSDTAIDEDTAVSPDTIVEDVTDPTVTVEQAGGQSDPTNSSPINFTVTFSEDVTGFTNGDVTIGGTANATTAVVPNGPATYNVAISGMANDGTVTVTLAAGVAADGASNSNEASTSTDNSVTFDTAAPTVALSYSKDPVRDADTLVITATFNEAVSGTPTIAIDVAGTADLSATSMTDSGDQTTFTFSYDVPAVLATSKSGTLLLRRDQGEMAVL